MKNTFLLLLALMGLSVQAQPVEFFGDSAATSENRTPVATYAKVYSSPGRDFLFFDSADTVEYVVGSFTDCPEPTLPTSISVGTCPDGNYDQVHWFDCNVDVIDLTALGPLNDVTFYESPGASAFNYLIVNADTCNIDWGLAFRADRFIGTFSVAQNVIYTQANNPFKPIPLPTTNSPVTATYLGADDGDDTLYWTKTWDYGGLIGNQYIQSGGGVIPDSAMIAWVDTVNPRVPGRAYIHSEMGIPFYKSSTDSTYWVSPGGTDTVAFNSGANGFFRLHHSLQYEYNTGGFRSTVYRDLADTTRGRLANVRNSPLTGLDLLVDPLLQPASNRGRTFPTPSGGTVVYPYTKLNGEPIPTVRWCLFAMRPIYDDESVSFNWPGQTTGDYTNASTDGPHFAFNIWQAKGKWSGVVTMNLKWQGERLTLIVQSTDTVGNVTVYRYVLIGPQSDTGYDELFSTYANQWLDFVVRMRPGFTARGDNPGLDFWFKQADSTNWRKLVTFRGNIASEVESATATIQNEYDGGVPIQKLGLANGGIYPSTRLSGLSLIDHFSPFRLSTPSRGFIKIDHSEYYYAEFGEGLEPDTTAMLTYATQTLGGTSITNDTLPVDSFALTVSDITDSSSTFSWPHIQGADDYQLRVLDGGGTFSNTTGILTNSYTVNGMEPDSAYSAWARVFPGTDPQDTVDIGGNFAQTPTVSFRTLPEDTLDTRPPEQVVIDSVVADTNSATVYWSGAARADIFYVTIVGGTTRLGSPIIVAGSTTDSTISFTGLPADSTMLVEVVSENPYGSTKSEQVFATDTLPAPVVLPAPDSARWQIVILKNGRAHAIHKIMWTDQVYRTLQIDVSSTLDYPGPDEPIDVSQQAGTLRKRIQILTPNE